MGPGRGVRWERVSECGGQDPRRGDWGLVQEGAADVPAGVAGWTRAMHPNAHICSPRSSVQQTPGSWDSPRMASSGPRLQGSIWSC